MLKIVSISAIVIIIIGGIVYAIISNTNPQPAIPDPTPTPFDANVTLENGSNPIYQGYLPSSDTTSPGSASVDGTIPAIAFFELSASETNIPTAFQVKLGFDPNSTHVESIKVGNIWTDSNILESEIDNGNGFVKFAAGQGFDASKTNGKILFAVNIRLNDANSLPKFNIFSESKYGYVGQSGLTPIDPNKINIKIVK